MEEKPHKFSFIDDNEPTPPPPPKANKKMIILAISSLIFAFSTAILGFKYLDSQNKLEEANEEFSQSLNEVIDMSAETFNDIQLRSRDTERRIDINSLATQLEVYYDRNGAYPDGATPGFELNFGNLPGLDLEALVDPDLQEISIGTSPETASDNGYHYLPTNCTAGKCTDYLLGVKLETEGAGLYTKISLN